MVTNIQKRVHYSALAAAIAACFGSTIQAQEQQTANNEADSAEIIEIRGFAASQRKNLNKKRFASTVKDIITAEDLGKFPDKNIGESLRRLPGVALNSRFGEGETVSIRGLSPSLSLTTLNGQTLAAAQWFEGNAPSRGFPVDLLASELVSSLEVFKSPQANIDEGSIGGSINIRTRKPLELDAHTLYGTVEMQYSDLAEEWDPQYSALYSWKSKDETFGIMAAFSSQTRSTNRENMENYLSAGVNVLDGSAPSGTSATWGAGSALFQQERERVGYNITAQYRPSDSLEFTLTYLAFGMEANNLNSNYLTVPGRLGSGGIRNVTEVSAQGVALTHDILVTESSDYWFGPDTFFRQSKPSNDIIDLSFEYDGDDYILKGSIGTTSADNDLFVWGLSGRVGPEAVASGLVSPDARTTLDISNGRLQQSFVNFDPSDPASYPAAANGARVRVEGTDETFAQIDYIVDLDSEFVPRIHIGGKFKAHEKVLDQYSFNEEWEAIFASQNVETYADLPTTVRSGLFSEQAGPNSLTTLPVFDMNQIIALGNSSIPNDVFAANRQTQNAFYRLEEDIFAAYIMAEFEGDKFSGNIGLRFVDTSLDSSGWEFANGNATQITTVSNDYTEILPSFNISYNITEDLLFRGAYSIAIARPNYADLAGGLNVTEETRTGSAGNPNLDPWKASQFDAGLEWYFDSTSLLGFTFFYKDLDTFVERAGSDEIVPGLEALGEFEIVRPRNGGSAELNGLEISYQTEFAYGFGLLANYTHTKADVVRLNGEEGDLPDNSETMWNFTPYWANESFEARVMVNHRGAYFNGFNRGSANFVDDFTSVDVAFTWHISESLDLNIQGLNVTNELWTARHSLEARDGIWRQLAENGSRWFAGINYRF